MLLFISFSACGYSNNLALKTICDENFSYVVDFTQIELMKRISEKCNRLNIPLRHSDKRCFLGDFVSNIASFNFSQNERALISTAIEHLKNENTSLSSSEEKLIEVQAKTVSHWICEEKSLARDETESYASRNLLSDMVNAFKKMRSDPNKATATTTITNVSACTPDY